MEAIRFVTHQAQVLQVHRNSAKFAFNFVKPENLKETLYPQDQSYALLKTQERGKRKKRIIFEVNECCHAISLISENRYFAS